MWVTRLKIKHDCTIAARCRRFNCTAFSLPLSSWHDKKYYYTSQRHIIEGNAKDIEIFLNELRKDKRIINIEVAKNIVFFIERRKKKDIPASHYNPKMFFVRPVFSEKSGYEYWELASWDKNVLMGFINGLKREKDVNVIIEKIQNEKLDTIYFPKVMPKLSDKQREAFQLAVENGYYKFPRKIDLGKLAKLMHVSLSTYQEHLRKAEEKIMPSYI